MELTEKIETALVAYLQAQTWPDYFPLELILPGESAAEKSSQCIACIADDGEEEPQYTGNFWHMVHVVLTTPAVIQTVEESEGGSIAPIDQHKAVAAALTLAMLADNLPDVLTAAAGDFTCIGAIDRKPTRLQEEGYWSSGFDVKLYCANKSL